jgi:1-deoxyxylulose-5-phosphate synthase
VRYQGLGRSGLRISVLGMGCAQWGRSVAVATAERLVRTGLDLGVTVFDTADTYGAGVSEETLGRAMRGVRDRMVVATKFRWATGTGPNDRGASRIHIRAAVEASLRRLGTDHIDLYQVHAPDPGTPIDETLAALDDLVAGGKVLYTGSSNFTGWQLVEAHLRAAHTGRTGFAGTQVPYSLLDRRAEAEILPAARHCGVGVLACLVLGRGYLAGSFDDGSDPAGLSVRQRAFLTPANRRRRAVVTRFAAERGVPPAAVALGVIAEQPGISGVLVGASSPEQLVANAAAVSTRLPAPDVAMLLAELDRAETGDPAPADPAPAGH